MQQCAKPVNQWTSDPIEPVKQYNLYSLPPSCLILYALILYRPTLFFCTGPCLPYDYS